MSRAKQIVHNVKTFILTEVRWMVTALRPAERKKFWIKFKLVFRRWLRWLLLYLYRTLRYAVSLLAPDLIFQTFTRHLKLLGYLILLSLANKIVVIPIFKVLKYILFFITTGPTETKLRTQLHASMKNATHFDDYSKYAQALDKLDGRSAWRQSAEDKNYNWHRVKQEIFEMEELRKKNDIIGLMDFLRCRLVRGSLGITRPNLYNVTRIGTKSLIEEYVKKIVNSLTTICNAPEKLVSDEEKLGFFSEVRHTHGRTALCLSGGARLGIYHLGVIKALHERQLIPRIITGASAGGFASAMLAVRKDEELSEWLQGDSISYHAFSKPDQTSGWGLFLERVRRMAWTGTLLDSGQLEKCVRGNVGDYTFFEAYQRTGRILSISVMGKESTTLPRLLNYLTAPNVVIWSAVVASCSVPGVFSSQELMVKEPNGEIQAFYLKGVEFSDGSFGSDIPTVGLSHLFNCNNFIVSQVNPHVVPLQKMPKTLPFVWSIFNFIIHEIRLYVDSLCRNLQRCGIFPSTVRWWHGVVMQEYFGDVTIFPDFRWNDLLNIFTNPNLNEIKQAIVIGSKSTYPHISLLTISCMIEFHLDSCLKTVRARVNGETGMNLPQVALEEEKDLFHCDENEIEFHIKGKKYSRVQSFIPPVNRRSTSKQHVKHLRTNTAQRAKDSRQEDDGQPLPSFTRQNSAKRNMTTSISLKELKSCGDIAPTM